MKMQIETKREKLKSKKRNHERLLLVNEKAGKYRKYRREKASKQKKPFSQSNGLDRASRLQRHTKLRPSERCSVQLKRL